MQSNCIIIIGLVAGTVIGYWYWNSIGLRWGTFPLSSEWWVNCIYGGLFGGLIMSLISKKQEAV